jgi:two-component system OmpR family response regulator
MAPAPIVLFVEDDPPLQALLQAIAARNHWECAVAVDGGQALRMLARKRYDAIVLDLLLPEINGFDVLRDMKCRSPLLLARTVVISAATPTTTAACAELQLVRCFLRKPFDIAELEQEIAGCFNPPEGDRRPVEGAPAEHAETGRRSDGTRRRVS